MKFQIPFCFNRRYLNFMVKWRTIYLARHLPALIKIILIIFINLPSQGYSENNCSSFYKNKALNRQFESNLISKSIDIFKGSNWEVLPVLKFSKVQQILKNEPEARWIFNSVHENRVEFAMGRSVSSRTSIMENGFLNQYQTKKSTGIFNPSAREKIESGYLGISQSEYSQLPY